MKVNRLFFALLLTLSFAFASAAQDAQSQALKLYRSIQREDWKQLYYLAAFSPNIRKHLGTPEAFAADVAKGIGQSENAKIVHQLFSGMKNIVVGKATVTGNKATAPTSSDVTLNGQKVHFKGLARMIKDGGVWKWDLSYTDDVQTATSNAIQELLGKPSK